MFDTDNCLNVGMKNRVQNSGSHNDLEPGPKIEIGTFRIRS
jgi:hypothetical protein